MLIEHMQGWRQVFLRAIEPEIKIPGPQKLQANTEKLTLVNPSKN